MSNNLLKQGFTRYTSIDGVLEHNSWGGALVVSKKHSRRLEMLKKQTFLCMKSGEVVEPDMRFTVHTRPGLRYVYYRGDSF